MLQARKAAFENMGGRAAMVSAEGGRARPTPDERNLGGISRSFSKAVSES